MNSKKLISILFLSFLLVGFFSSFHIRKAEAVPLTVTRTFSSLTYDGTIQVEDYPYGTVRNLTSGLPNSGTESAYLGQYYYGAYMPYGVFRSFLYFDTSIIPSNANITNVNLSINIKTDLSTTDFNIIVQYGLSNTYPHMPMQAIDYYYLYYLGNGGQLSTTTISLGYNNITLNSEGKSYINKGSTTKLCLRSDHDVNNQAPTTNERIELYFAEKGAEYAPKLYVTYEVGGNNYIVYGPYYESGVVANCIVNVTLYSKTENPYPFVLNGTDGVADTVTINAEQGWFFCWNASNTATRSYYLTSATFDELWVYVADPTKTYDVYTVNFMDLAGILTTDSLVKVTRYINGIKTVERQAVDMEKKVSFYLEMWMKYTLTIQVDGSYTYGDLLFTSETSMTLTLKGIEFPQDIILAYQYNRIYAYRHNNQSSISVVYQDTQEELSNVKIDVQFENGSSVSGSYPYWQNSTYYFNHTYTSAIYNTTYIVKVMIYHPTYGNMPYNTVLAQGWTQQPFALPIGTIPGMNIANVIPIIIILACFLAFSQINAPTGAFVGTMMAIVLTWWGWIIIPSGLLVSAVAFTIMFGLAYARRKG